MGVFGNVDQFQDQQIHAAGVRTEPLVLDAATPDALTSDNFGRTVRFDRAAGVDVTLPAATGSGGRYRCLVGVTVTSNDINIRCAGTDEFAGTILQTDTDTSDTLASYPALAADNFDVISLNGGTTGGFAGDWIELEDIASGVWAVYGHINGTGTVATPFGTT